MTSDTSSQFNRIDIVENISRHFLVFLFLTLSKQMLDGSSLCSWIAFTIAWCHITNYIIYTDWWRCTFICFVYSFLSNLYIANIFHVFISKFSFLWLTKNEKSSFFDKGSRDILWSYNVRISSLSTDFATVISFRLVWYGHFLCCSCVSNILLWGSVTLGFPSLVTKLLQLTLLFDFCFGDLIFNVPFYVCVSLLSQNTSLFKGNAFIAIDRAYKLE